METHDRRFRKQNECGSVSPEYSHFDSPEGILRDAEAWGFADKLRELLGLPIRDVRIERLRIVRDIAYELASAQNRDLAVDLLVYATGLAAFGGNSLREYGTKHGCSHEWFRVQSRELSDRLLLPILTAPVAGDDDRNRHAA